MHWFLTLSSVFGFAGLAMACSRPNERGGTSYFLAFLALLFFVFARRFLVDGDPLSGVSLVFVIGLLALALGSGVVGIVRADGLGRIPPFGAALGAGALLFGVGMPLFEEPEALPEPAVIDRKISELAFRRSELEDRLDQKLPRLIRKLEKDADVARRELSTAGAAQKVRLNDELLEIAEQFVAAEKEKSLAQDLVDRIRLEERRLQRLRASKEAFDENDGRLAGELDRLWKEAATQLDRPVGQRLDGGALDESLVQKKLAELLNH